MLHTLKDIPPALRPICRQPCLPTCTVLHAPIALASQDDFFNTLTRKPVFTAS